MHSLDTRGGKETIAHRKGCVGPTRGWTQDGEHSLNRNALITKLPDQRAGGAVNLHIPLLSTSRNSARLIDRLTHGRRRPGRWLRDRSGNRVGGRGDCGGDRGNACRCGDGGGDGRSAGGDGGRDGRRGRGRSASHARLPRRLHRGGRHVVLWIAADDGGGGRDRRRRDGGDAPASRAQRREDGSLLGEHVRLDALQRRRRVGCLLPDGLQQRVDPRLLLCGELLALREDADVALNAAARLHPRHRVAKVASEDLHHGGAGAVLLEARHHDVADAGGELRVARGGGGRHRLQRAREHHPRLVRLHLRLLHQLIAVSLLHVLDELGAVEHIVELRALVGLVRALQRVDGGVVPLPRCRAAARRLHQRRRQRLLLA
mmetsp:Transcript_27184/g.79390  ORF Transcript_27184/g.79390 Transcript_27184/m.79390 type:complete len:374 (-) Transcript_27184:588-1709(-)